MFQTISTSTKSTATLDIKRELDDIKVKISQTENLFENTNDSDLIDACIYQLKALSAQRTYLYKIAKSDREI